MVVLRPLGDRDVALTRKVIGRARNGFVKIVRDWATCAYPLGDRYRVNGRAAKKDTKR